MGDEVPYHGSMAYDEALATRIRELIAGRPHLTEKKMFGGLAFLIGGNMSVSASGQGGLLVRVGPDQSDALVAAGEAEMAFMGGRTMRGWLRIASERVQTKDQLARWVDRGATYAQSLPRKRGS